MGETMEKDDNNNNRKRVGSETETVDSTLVGGGRQFKATDEIRQTLTQESSRCERLLDYPGKTAHIKRDRIEGY